MKKIVALLVALMLVCSAAAMAATTDIARRASPLCTRSSTSSTT